MPSEYPLRYFNAEQAASGRLGLIAMLGPVIEFEDTMTAFSRTPTPEMMYIWLEQLFENLKDATYISLEGDTFDIQGLRADAEPRGLLLDTQVYETTDMGSVAHYAPQLDKDTLADLCISRPPVRLGLQHCLVRGQIRIVLLH